MRHARISPRRSQLDSGFVERGTLQLNRLHRAAVIELFPWSAPFPGKPEPKPAPKKRLDGMKLAHHYQALLDTGNFENRAALARHVGVSRARVTQVLKRLDTNPITGSTAAQGTLPKARQTEKPRHQPDNW